MTWPPGPVFRSLCITLLVSYSLALGITLALGGGVGMDLAMGSFTSIGWRVCFVMALLWVELHRQSTHLFLANMGVSRGATMRSLLLVYVVLETLLLTTSSLAVGA